MKTIISIIAISVLITATICGIQTGKEYAQDQQRQEILHQKTLQQKYAEQRRLADEENRMAIEKKFLQNVKEKKWDEAKEKRYTPKRKALMVQYEENKNWRGLISIYDSIESEFANACKKQSVDKISHNDDESFYWLICEEEADIHAAKGSFYQNIGNYKSAVTEYSKATNRMTKMNCVYSKMELVKCCIEGGMYKMAIDECSEMLSTDESNKSFQIVWNFDLAYIYGLRGWCHEMTGNNTKALTDYNKAAECCDKATQENINLPASESKWCGWLCCIEDMDFIYLKRGEQYRRGGNNELARAEFERAIEINNTTKTTSCRSYALHYLGHNSEAIRGMNRIVAEHPKDKNTYYNKACLYALMGEYDEATAALETAFEYGFRSIAQVENDKYLNLLRGSVQLNELINKYQYRK